VQTLVDVVGLDQAGNSNGYELSSLLMRNHQKQACGDIERRWIE